MESLRVKLNSRLRAHVQETALQNFCKIDAARLEKNAIPNIGSIELVSGADFATIYDDLYISNFPQRLERERSDLIVERLKKDFVGERHGLSPYHIIGIRDHEGSAIGAAHFSVLKLIDTLHAVPYLQYLYVRPQNRRQDMAEVMHTMILAVASADALGWDRTVPFTLFECEPPGYGSDETARTISTQRAQIHTRAGAVAMMLQQESGSALRTAHVQPGLELGDEPLTLVWAIRPTPTTQQKFDIGEIGNSLLKAYYQSLRDEGFPESNIALAEDIASKRCQGYAFVMIPLMDVVPNVEEYIPS